MKELVMKYVVQNAAKFGSPNEKAVIGKVIAENPELKAKVGEIIELVKECIKEYNSLNEDDKRILAEKFSEEKKVEKERIPELPPLEKAEKGKVVMRFAPNPNGPPTIGSARGIIINGEYVKMYKGKYIIRFDDTDPKTKRPMLEAYDWYLEDIEWLGYKPDEVIYASKRIPKYYEYARKLVEMGKAYVCFCEREKFKEIKAAGLECEHRNAAIEDNVENWEKMLEGKFREGEAVLRIKTDMKHPDPAIRDWVAFRIIYTSHPLVGDAYFVYPTLDFESAIEDKLCGTTHILRGKDLMDSEKKQRYIYEYFGWEYPVTKHWGRVKIYEFGKLSTSGLKRDIQAGKFEGWDDPRVPTVRALRRRGFDPEAIRKFFISLGLGENEVAVSMNNLYAENRKIIDPKANRYFFVWEPVEIKIEGLPEEKRVELPLNPNREDKRVLKGESRVLITREDFEKFRGEMIRLKGFCNIKLDKVAEFIEFEIGNVKKGKIIHWLPASEVKKCKIIGEVNMDGFCEANVVRDLGNVVQFERFAFCRIEKMVDDYVKAIYTHP
ncbi:MAG: glutamate--tRNA ligase [Archaeoglobaceae archaeon]